MLSFIYFTFWSSEGLCSDGPRIELAVAFIYYKPKTASATYAHHLDTAKRSVYGNEGLSESTIAACVVHLLRPALPDVYLR